MSVALPVRSEKAPSAVAALAPEAKIVAVVAFCVVVVATPAAAWPAFVVDAAALLLLMRGAGLSARRLLPRLLVEAPFVVFALVLPFVAHGRPLALGPLTVSAEGLTAAALLLARATLGVGAALLLAETTTRHDLVDGLGRLRLPRQLVEILTFMVRFASVVADDLHRMSIARAARGDGAGRLGRWAATAGGAGTLFVRCYGRGERVHLAMHARGYAGALPDAGGDTPRTDLLRAGTLPLVGLLALVGALAWAAR